MTVPLPAASQPSKATTVGISASSSAYWSRRSRSSRAGKTRWYSSLERAAVEVDRFQHKGLRGRKDKPEVV